MQEKKSDYDDFYNIDTEVKHSSNQKEDKNVVSDVNVRLFAVY